MLSARTSHASPRFRCAPSPDGKHILALVANGDGGEFAHYLLGPSGKWVQLTQFDDKITGAAFGQDQALYLLSRKGTPRGQICDCRWPIRT